MEDKISERRAEIMLFLKRNNGSEKVTSKKLNSLSNDEEEFHLLT
jgi:hypothetical protein